MTLEWLRFGLLNFRLLNNSFIERVFLIVCVSVAAAGCSDNSKDGSDGSQGESGGTSIPTVTGSGLYQTGFILVQSVRENIDENELVTLNFVTDAESSRISDNLPFSGDDTPDFFYDDNGRIDVIDSYTPTSAQRKVAYNADGTLNEIDLDNGDTALTVTFVYDDGRLVSRRSLRYLQPQTFLTVVNFLYDENGRLVESVQLDDQTNELVVGAGHMFTVDEAGRIVEIIAKVDTSDATGQRNVLTYDDGGNIIKHEIYAAEGRLQSVITNTYEPSSTLSPNVMGFLSAINADFIPIDILSSQMR